LGGDIPEGPGAFYPATVLDAVTKGLPAYEKEMFGPVATVISVENEKERK
jgi:succinate-semialdehyde dehydrogenase/glutarate-semialdehyde dehydrogenase